MANEQRLRTGFSWGTITDNPLTNVATTVNSAAFAALPAVSASQHLVLVLDPGASAGAPEVVYVTAHTASATSVTVARAQEGSSARQHASGIRWVHAPTARDFPYQATNFAGLPATPIVGELGFDVATKKAYMWNGTDWQPFGAGGALGYAQATANQTGITTNVDLTSLSVAVTAATGRRLRITGSVGIGVSNTDTTARLLIQEGATVLQRRDVKPDVTDATTNLLEVNAIAVVTPSAGAHTYKLTCERVAGTGNVQVGAASTHPAFILVEDIGAA